MAVAAAKAAAAAAAAATAAAAARRAGSEAAGAAAAKAAADAAKEAGETTAKSAAMAAAKAAAVAATSTGAEAEGLEDALCEPITVGNLIEKIGLLGRITGLSPMEIAGLLDLKKHDYYRWLNKPALGMNCRLLVFGFLDPEDTDAHWSEVPRQTVQAIARGIGLMKQAKVSGARLVLNLSDREALVLAPCLIDGLGTLCRTHGFIQEGAGGRIAIRAKVKTESRK